MVSTLLNVETNRAFSNLFEVTISETDDTKNQIRAERARFGSLKNLASKVSFEDSFGLEMEFNEAVQAFTLTSPLRIKGMSITFKETAQYAVIDVLKDWLNSIYDFEGHFFKGGVNPTRVITISLDDGINTSKYIIYDAILKSIAYPSYSWSEVNAIEIQATFAIGRVKWEEK